MECEVANIGVAVGQETKSEVTSGESVQNWALTLNWHLEDDSTLVPSSDSCQK